MKAVDVPLVDYNACLELLRATRLGHNFMLDPVSFICAGGEQAKGLLKIGKVKLNLILSFYRQMHALGMVEV